MKIDLNTFSNTTNGQELIYKSNKIVAFINRSENRYSCIFNTNEKVYYNTYKNFASNDDRLISMDSYSGTFQDVNQKLIKDISNECRIYILKDRYHFIVKPEILNKFCHLVQKYHSESLLLNSSFSDFLWSFITDNEKSLRNSMYIINNLLKDIILEKH